MLYMKITCNTLFVTYVFKAYISIINACHCMLNLFKLALLSVWFGMASSVQIPSVGLNDGGQMPLVGLGVFARSLNPQVGLTF